MKDVASIFLNAIKKDGARVKLLGDSITHGVGGTGFAQNGVHIVENFSRNPDGFCWAKLFKEYLAEKYGCEVVNNACTGTRIEFILDHFDTLVDKNDDIVICTIGTNNRHKFFYEGPKREREELITEFALNIERLYEKFRNIGVEVIFIANIPASAKNELDGENYWRILHMNDINNVYKSEAEKLGFPFISLYELFIEYCENKKINFETLLDDGLHPNDEGYKVMFSLIKSALRV